ncbi:MAG: hypothetical protein RPR97_05075, partial [Colwellia sp.]
LKVLFFDKYSISNRLIKNLREKGVYIVGFDDFGLQNDNYDLLIDHNFSHEAQGVDRKILGGYEYSVLDGQFKEHKKNGFLIKNEDVEDKSDSRLNLFVNLGSGPVSNYEEMILKSFTRLKIKKMFNVYWLVNNDLSILHSKDELKFGIKRIAYIENMAEFLIDMDLAIGSCGVNAIERCCMGIPSLIFKTVENQQRNHLKLMAEKLAVPANSVDDIIDSLNCFFINPKKLKVESDRCSLSVDGKGAGRVANEICSLLNTLEVEQDFP